MDTNANARPALSVVQDSTIRMTLDKSNDRLLAIRRRLEHLINTVHCTGLPPEPTQARDSVPAPVNLPGILHGVNNVATHIDDIEKQLSQLEQGL